MDWNCDNHIHIQQQQISKQITILPSTHLWAIQTKKFLFVIKLSWKVCHMIHIYKILLYSINLFKTDFYLKRKNFIFAYSLQVNNLKVPGQPVAFIPPWNWNKLCPVKSRRKINIKHDTRTISIESISPHCRQPYLWSQRKLWKENYHIKEWKWAQPFWEEN